ncbi:uncharacterized protein K02A2.6-like [Eupeodes corollae]|uniref:uncharacterized protein K02A2.6-like n=1 Tax=Eupeodes corollae TaxID=290404 RepID=UPI002493368D|nr:uncharacterized protein K02A2.6-like [Eupeodes corollae]
MTEDKVKVINNNYKQVAVDSGSLRPLDLKSTNLAAAWKIWKKQFKIFLAASDLLSDSDFRKNSLLLHHIGPESFEIFDSFDVDEETIKHADLITKFDAYFLPKCNVIMERFNFFSRRQSTSESIDEFLTALKNLSKTCNFGTLKDELVRDLFICGLNQSHQFIREKLLNESSKNLEEIIQIAKSLEIAKQQSKEFIHGSNGEDNSKVEFIGSIRERERQQQWSNQGKRNNNFRKTKNQIQHEPSGSNNNQLNTCGRCGQRHFYNKCPAWGVTCQQCRGKNHYAKMCNTNKIKKTIGNIEAEGESATQSSEEDLFIGKIMSSTYTKAWNVDIDINNQVVVAQVDTGAEGNIMSIKKFEMLNLDKNLIKETNTNLLTFSGEKLRVKGKCKLYCLFKNNGIYLDFYILEMNCKTVIGLDTSIKLNLVKNINIVRGAKNQGIKGSNMLLEKYKEAFNGLGCLKNKCKLVLKENVLPVVEPPRKIPFDLQKELKTELKRMENLGVIVQENQPTKWVNSIVLVRKANGNLRVCLDPRHLNKVIMRPHFPFSDIDEVKSRLSNAKYFSSLDANSGFWMIPLEEESSKLCTFNTPFGRYRFIRLPFGVNAAPEIFHAEMIKHFFTYQML